VLGNITFDVTFTCVGWEGSAHDFCILNDALIRPEDSKFLKVSIILVMLVMKIEMEFFLSIVVFGTI
jgi:hypothetical protein